MTPEEEFIFDLEGYLVLKGILSSNEVDEVNALADAVEDRLQNGQEITLPQNCNFESVRTQWNSLLESV